MGGSVAVPEMKPAPTDSTVVYVQHMERSERERERGRTKEVSLFEFQSPSLFGQAQFACSTGAVG